MAIPKFDTPAEFEKAIKEYWENEKTVSIIDKNLHRIEIDTVLSHLEASDHVADIGCGDGGATVQYARKVKQVSAFERSDNLRRKAAQRFAEEGVTNVALDPGDIMKMDGITDAYDAVVTQRMLINLPSWETQQTALLNVRRMIKPGGRLIMVENTDDGAEALNRMRAEMDLAPIPQHWHNLFFDYDKLTAFMAGKFDAIAEHDFGLYYFLTRLYVPMFASFTGFGANAKKDPIFDHSDAAARRLFEAFKDQVKFSGCRALGPIQCFVFRRL